MMSKDFIQRNANADIVFIADPRVLKIPVQENNEPLFDLRAQEIITFGPSPEIPNNTDYTKVRLTVYHMLINAQEYLPKNLRLCLYEGYRSTRLQEQLFNNYFDKVKKKYPSWDHQEIFLETTKLVAPVNNIDGSLNIPPHSTGGAIDIYLIDNNKQPVDMGIRVEDWMTDIDGRISQTNSSEISEDARKYRSILSNVLQAAGFVNCPTEYWHWSYGDRYWAYHENQEHAIYNQIKNSYSV
jgi:zinc D-Ala-D-Ala dipeptidase